jgi:hypothetical protein
MILISKQREVVVDTGPLTYQASGHFRIVARSPRYKGERVLADFKNLILDQGLLRLAASGGASSVGFIQLGTGTTTPAASQTALTTYSSSISNILATTNSYVAGPPPYGQVVYQYRGTIGGNTGTFSEIGIGWANVGSLSSRALILDTGGSPTTITVLSDEQLDVYYTFRWYFPTVDGSGTVTINGTGYPWTSRAAGISYIFNAQLLLSYGLFGQRAGNLDNIYPAGTALGAITSSPSGTPAPSSSAFTTYTAPNLYVDTSSVFPLTSTPAGGVGALLVNMHSGAGGDPRGIQVAFSTPIPKLSTQILTLATRATIARYP